MKKSILLLLMICSTITINAQQSKVDSLKKALVLAKDDYTRFRYRTDLFNYYYATAPDSAAPYVEQNIYVAKRINSDSLLFIAFRQFATISNYTGNFATALHYTFEAIKAAERTKDLSLIISANTGLSELYGVNLGDYKRAVLYAKRLRQPLIPVHHPFLHSTKERGIMAIYFTNWHWLTKRVMNLTPHSNT